jgi:lipoprotein-anchoring transpeptidase ErfK/SrfK
VLSSGERWYRSGLAVVVAGVFWLTACGGDDGGEEASPPSSSEQDTDVESTVGAPVLPEGNVWVARARLPQVDVFADSRGDEVVEQLDNPNEHGAELVFLVDGTDVSVERLPVYLPVPPNGSKGWVNSADVSLVANPYWIRIELDAHRLSVTKADEVTVETTVGLGREGRETPAGLYYVKELLEPPDPGGVYGPYAYGISGFSNNPEVVEEFGSGVIGIHGTNDPGSIGQDVSSGCIRVPNETITEMAGYLPLGTPVEIVA